MASHLRNCAQLDRQIREEASKRSIFDPELRRLRSSLRSECEAALLADFRLSQKHDVEQLLWKAVFYRPIEEFRRRIKQAEGELKAKTKLAFQAFLEDGKAFYLQLLLRLQQRCGPAGLPSALLAQHLHQMGLEEPAPLPPSSRPLDCRTSVHRCLVCLGDLSRYQVNAQPAAERCWAQCRRFYQLAARVAPSVGSAYNQLAVLCSYEADDLGAAFFYIRALAAPSPFAVARENLVAHFEQNRGASQRLAAAAAGAGAAARGARPASQALRELRIRFTRLLGMLFTRDALDAFPGLLAAAMADLDDHLQRVRQQSRKAALAAAADQQPPVLVQLAACAAYAAAHARAAAAGASGAGGPPSFAAAAHQQLVGSLSLQLLLGLAARLAAAAAAVAAGARQGLLGSAAGVLLLPPLRLLLRWLAGAGPDALLPPAGLQPKEAAELAAAQRQLWLAAAQLVSALREPAQQDSVAAGPAGAAVDAPGASEPAALLAEDEQLAGFPPLEAGASCGGEAPVRDATVAADYGEPAAAAARVRCILADAARIAAALDRAVSGGGGGTAGRHLGLAEEVASFIAAATPAEAAAEEQPAPRQLVQQTAQEQAQQAQQAQQPQQGQQHQQDMPPPSQRAGRAANVPADAPAAMEEEEEEQEVILYAPQARGTPPAAASMQQPQQGAPPLPPQPEPAPQQHTVAASDKQLDTDVLMAETAEAVAGSVLPLEDRGAPPTLASLGGLQAPAAPASIRPPAAPIAEPPGQQLPAAAPDLPPGQQSAVQQPALPWLLPGAAAPAASTQLQQHAPQGAILAPPILDAPSAGGTPAQPALPLQHQQQRQQVAPPLPWMGHPAAAATSAPAGPMHGQQPQPAVGLRSLLFDNSMPGPAGLLGMDGWPRAPQAAAPAGPAVPAAPAAPSALLSGGSAAERWAWMGAFGSGPAPAADGLAAQALPAAAHAPQGAGQLAAPAGQQAQQAQHPRTDNPYLP